jgi:sugar phosphate isomerase/epimerase
VPRPVTLLTGQWADLPLEEVAPLAKEMGYDGLELTCWGTISRWAKPSRMTGTLRVAGTFSKSTT